MNERNASAKEQKSERKHSSLASHYGKDEKKITNKTRASAKAAPPSPPLLMLLPPPAIAPLSSSSPGLNRIVPRLFIDVEEANHGVAEPSLRRHLPLATPVAPTINRSAPSLTSFSLWPSFTAPATVMSTQDPSSMDLSEDIDPAEQPISMDEREDRVEGAFDWGRAFRHG